MFNIIFLKALIFFDGCGKVPLDGGFDEGWFYNLNAKPLAVIKLETQDTSALGSSPFLPVGRCMDSRTWLRPGSVREFRNVSGSSIEMTCEQNENNEEIKNRNFDQHINKTVPYF